MSTTTQTAAVPISMTAIVKMSVADIAKFVQAQFAQSRIAYSNAAKGIVAVSKALFTRYNKEPEPKRIFTELAKHGVKDSDFKNGQQLAGLWPLLVETGLLTESAFEQIDYGRAVEIRAVIRRLSNTDRGLPASLDADTAKTVVKLLAGPRDELTSQAENGCSEKEFKAKVAETTKKIAEKSAAASTPAATPIVETPIVETPAAPAGTPPEAPAPVVAGTPTPAAAPAKGTKVETDGKVTPINSEAARFGDLQQALKLAAKISSELVTGNKAMAQRVVELWLSMAEGVAGAAKAAETVRASNKSKGKKAA